MNGWFLLENGKLVSHGFGETRSLWNWITLFGFGKVEGGVGDLRPSGDVSAHLIRK
jgi:hypothetical protein